MKKRLRKKKRVGEFAQYGFEVSAALRCNDGNKTIDLDNLLDEFIDYIESLALFCAGGINPSRQRAFDFIIELGMKGEADALGSYEDTSLEFKRSKVIDWVKSKSGLVDVKASEIFDLWYPPKEVLSFTS